MTSKLDRLLVVVLLVTAGANLYAAIELSGDTLVERIARVVLFALGVATAWPRIQLR